MKISVRILAVLVFIGLIVSCPVVPTGTSTQNQPLIVGTWKAQSSAFTSSDTTNANADAFGPVYMFNADGTYNQQSYSFSNSNYHVIETGNYSYDSSTKTLTLNKVQRDFGAGLTNIGAGQVQKTVYDSVGITSNSMIIGYKGGNTSNLQGTWTGTTNNYLYNVNTPDSSTSAKLDINISTNQIIISRNGATFLTADYSNLVMAQSKLTISNSSSQNINQGGIPNTVNYFAIADGVISAVSTVPDNIHYLYIRQ